MRPRYAFLALAMLLPTALAWLYFDVFAGEPIMRWLYPAAKIVQAGVPLLGWWLLRLPRPVLTAPGTRGVASGLLTGLAFGLPVLLLAWLAADASLLGGIADEARVRLRPFAAESPLGYVTLTAALSVVHSLFEEYYWRWFLYGELRRTLARPFALGLASLAFTAHHVIVVRQLLGDAAPLAAVLAGVGGVLIAGACWCLLYERHSLASPWLSHLLADAAIFAAGAMLLWR